MIYTCPKCGKKMDLSTEVLISSDYKVICPQCLSQLQIVGDYAYIPHDSLDLDTGVEPSHTISCPKCGHEASSNAHFCPNCGTSFDAPVTAVDAAPEDVTVLPPPLPDNDPLYQDVLQFLMTCSSITPMMLRDHFHISDERAANLIRLLEEDHVIGPYNNGGPRQILIPHRGMYSAPVPPQDSRGKEPQPRRLSCLSIILIVMFFMIVMNMCTG